MEHLVKQHEFCDESRDFSPVEEGAEGDGTTNGVETAQDRTGLPACPTQARDLQAAAEVGAIQPREQLPQVIALSSGLVRSRSELSLVPNQLALKR
jgi:hypothetical protein